MLSNTTIERHEIPPPRGRSKDGIAYTKDFDVKFLKAQRDELLRWRDSGRLPDDGLRTLERELDYEERTLPDRR